MRRLRAVPLRSVMNASGARCLSVCAAARAEVIASKSSNGLCREGQVHLRIGDEQRFVMRWMPNSSGVAAS